MSIEYEYESELAAERHLKQHLNVRFGLKVAKSECSNIDHCFKEKKALFWKIDLYYHNALIFLHRSFEATRARVDVAESNNVPSASDPNPPVASASSELVVVGTECAPGANMDNSSDAQAEQQSSIQPYETSSGTPT